MDSSRIRKVLAVAATAALGTGLFAGLGPQAGVASSHREAPLSAADPQIDATDLYAFRSPDRPSTVTLISDWIPFEEPAGGPNFYLFAQHTNYDIRIDNNGDAKPDIIYRWKFKTHFRSADSFLYNNGQVTSLHDPNLNIFQTYDLFRIMHGHSNEVLHNAPVAPSNVGAASMPNYNSHLFDTAVTSFGPAPSFSWAGQADDPFFLDLRVFDLAYGGNLSEVGDDTLAGFNVNAFAIQVPIRSLQSADGNRIVGIWTTASRPSTRIEHAGTQTFKGPLTQVARLGNPLVNEVVVPVGAKDFFNSSHPSGDAAFLPKVEDPELPHVLNALYGIPVPDSDPNTPGIQRDDLVSVFLTGIGGLNEPPAVVGSEELRLNMDTPICGTGGAPACSSLGVLGGDPQGFPNGRRLSDDVIDEALRVMEGVLLPGHPAIVDTLGDGVGANDVPFNASFPYVGFPHSGSDPMPHP